MHVKDVNLAIGPENAAGTRQVTVSYKLVFAAAEERQEYKVAITLRGEDLPGDDETPAEGPPNPLRTFRFGSRLLPYTTVTAEAGETSYTWTRTVSSDALDEDPLEDKVEVNHKTDWVFHPHGDEIYAQVVASREARSATVPFLLGV